MSVFYCNCKLSHFIQLLNGVTGLLIAFVMASLDWNGKKRLKTRFKLHSTVKINMRNLHQSITNCNLGFGIWHNINQIMYLAGSMETSFCKYPQFALFSNFQGPVMKNMLVPFNIWLCCRPFYLCSDHFNALGNIILKILDLKIVVRSQMFF